jgi:hypothetical protein
MLTVSLYNIQSIRDIYTLILFNWEKIYRETEGKTFAIMSIISYLTFPHLPLNRYDSTYQLSLRDWSGDSFLLHPEKLIVHRKEFGDPELAQYVALASFRSYAEYKATGKTTLDMLLAPVGQKLIDYNRLLTRVNDQIYFCWEEVTH